MSEELIAEALHPYDGITVATKGGLTRTGPDVWPPVGRPEYLRQCCEMSLRRLGVDRSTSGSSTASTRRCRARSSSA